MAIQDGTILEFSIDSATTTYGIVQNFQITDQTERAEARGELGNTVSIQEYDQKKTFSMNYYSLATPTSPPTIGTAFTFEGDSYILESVQEGRTVDGFQTYDVTGTFFPNLP